MTALRMPVLEPVPIPTRDVPYPVALWRWLTQVREWRVVEPWYFTLPDGTEIVIPAGFQFDGASVPAVFWSVLSPTGLLLIPGLIHDFYYKYGHLINSIALRAEWMYFCNTEWPKSMSAEYPFEDFLNTRANCEIPKYGDNEGRAFGDRLFRDVAIHINGFHVINRIAWVALILFGWVAWNKHRKEDVK